MSTIERGFNMLSRKANRKIINNKYFLLLSGAAILAFGLYNIHSQSSITEGGLLGMTLLLNNKLGISPGITGL